MRADYLRTAIVSIAMLSVLGFAAGARASTVEPVWGLNYTLATPAGITGTGPWSGTGNNGFQVVHSVVRNLVGGNYVYTYNYSFTGVGGVAMSADLSHVIIEVSDSFTPANLLAGTTTPNELRSVAHPTSSFTGWTGLGGLPGVKFEPLSASTYSLTIVSDRTPMLGSFYAKTGQNEASTASGAEFWVPNTDFGAPEIIPLPAAVWGGLALLGMVVAGRLRGRQSRLA
jgi:hypothetical protein